MDFDKFYDWSNNCKLLGLTLDQADNCLDDDDDLTQKEIDHFWTEYHHGNNERVVSI